MWPGNAEATVRPTGGRPATAFETMHCAALPTPWRVGVIALTTKNLDSFDSPQGRFLQPWNDASFPSRRLVQR